MLRDRWFADSPVEETRFEPLVPSRERVGLLGKDGNAAVGEKDKSRGTKVRSLLPPQSAESVRSDLQRTPILRILQR
jgi:hypothetical protein